MPFPTALKKKVWGISVSGSGFPSKTVATGRPLAGIEHQLLLIDVGDVHRVGGGAPADPGVAAKDDGGNAWKGDAEGVHRRPAAAGDP